MGISEFLTGAICGVAAWEFARDTWRRMRASADEIKPVPVEPERIHSFLSTPDLLAATIDPNAELQRIERELCKRVGAKFDSNEADVVMHAVRDGHDWNAVLDLERDYLFGKCGTKNRVARWI